MFIRCIVIAALVAGLNASAGAADPRGCPPGLAKKAIPCVPPGQAKKWGLGRPSVHDYRDVDTRAWQRPGLPRPANGTRWVLVGDQVLRVDRSTGRVIETMPVWGRIDR